MLLSLLIVLLLYIFLYVNNHWIVVKDYELHFEDLPENFSGMTIVHLSDLHDATFGKDQKRLIKKVKKEQPDYIFFTGDFVDSNRYELHNSLQVIDELVNIAPIYYVIGNHEVATNKVDDIVETLEEIGVTVLQNDAVTITRGLQALTIGGIDDPLMRVSEQINDESIIASNIEKAFSNVGEVDQFKLLLSHRPEFLDVYAQQNLQVVFAGHAHGGQVRLPLIGGLVSPGQGWFPEYTSGVYQSFSTKMVVNRGLGNSLIPFRIFNFPEVVVVTLTRS